MNSKRCENYGVIYFDSHQEWRDRVRSGAVMREAIFLMLDKLNEGNLEIDDYLMYSPYVGKYSVTCSVRPSDE